MSTSDVVIRVGGPGQEVFPPPRAGRALHSPKGCGGPPGEERAESEEEFWALKDVSFQIRLAGVLWPRERTGCAETGSPEFPVVLLEVQMHPDLGFHHRLAAQTFRFLQRHPQVERLEILPSHHDRLERSSLRCTGSPWRR